MVGKGGHVSNYPGGFANGLRVREVNVLNSYAGNVFWVDSGTGSDSNKGTFDRPFATLDYAIGQCTANNGDIIVIKPGHSENVSSAGAITFDVAGVTVVGMGHYASRPAFTFDTTTNADIDVTADDVVIQNVVFKADLADVTKGFDVTAKGFTMDGVEFKDNDTDKNFVVCINATSTTNNTADGLAVVGSKYLGQSTNNDHFIETAADLDDFRFIGNYISMGVNDGETIIEALTGKDWTNIQVLDNQFYRLNTANIIAMESDQTANSGIIARNYVGHADVAGETPFDVSGARLFENYATATDDTSGYLLPTVDS